MTFHSQPFRKPAVYVTESEHERLSSLAEASASRGAILLGDELLRAIVLKDGEFPHAHVRLGSFVAYTDLMTGRSRRVQIVLPDEADIDQDRLSVLTPVGAALFGLMAGDSIGLHTENGGAHVLQIASVEPS